MKNQQIATEFAPNLYGKFPIFLETTTVAPGSLDTAGRDTWNSTSMSHFPSIM